MFWIIITVLTISFLMVVTILVQVYLFKIRRKKKLTNRENLTVTIKRHDTYFQRSSFANSNNNISSINSPEISKVGSSPYESRNKHYYKNSQDFEAFNNNCLFHSKKNSTVIGSLNNDFSYAIPNTHKGSYNLIDDKGLDTNQSIEFPDYPDHLQRALCSCHYMNKNHQSTKAIFRVDI